jgi:hypothetical protein
MGGSRGASAQGGTPDAAPQQALPSPHRFDLIRFLAPDLTCILCSPLLLSLSLSLSRPHSSAVIITGPHKQQTLSLSLEGVTDFFFR